MTASSDITSISYLHSSGVDIRDSEMMGCMRRTASQAGSEGVRV